MFKSKREKELELKVKQLESNNSQLIKEVIEKNEMNIVLYNFVKAILKTLNLREFEIGNTTIEEVRKYELYVEESLMKFAKTIKLIAPQQIINIKRIYEDLEKEKRD